MSETHLNRLRWRCRRGMRELDILLEPWLVKHGASLSGEELERFSTLLDCNDMDLYTWFTGRGEPDDAELAALISRIGAKH